MKVFFCETCAENKNCKISSLSCLSKSTMPLQLVHIDVCVKIYCNSLIGSEYFVTFTGDFHVIFAYNRSNTKMKFFKLFLIRKL